jgi:hypothetical protein
MKVAVFLDFIEDHIGQKLLAINRLLDSSIA